MKLIIKLFIVFIFLTNAATAVPFFANDSTIVTNVDPNYLELSLFQIIIVQAIMIYLVCKINTYMCNNTLFIMNMSIFFYFLLNVNFTTHYIYIYAMVIQLSIAAMNIEKYKEYKQQS